MARGLLEFHGPLSWLDSAGNPRWTESKDFNGQIIAGAFFQAEHVKSKQRELKSWKGMDAFFYSVEHLGRLVGAE